MRKGSSWSSLEREHRLVHGKAVAFLGEDFADVASRSAVITFCIFIASITTRRSPAFTSWPGVDGDFREEARHRREQEARAIRRRLLRHEAQQLRRRRGSTCTSNCVPRCVRR
jgi:hypothetical protein